MRRAGTTPALRHFTSTSSTDNSIIHTPLFVKSNPHRFLPLRLAIFAFVNSLLTKTTSGVRITVHPRFEENLSFATEDSFVFSYHITLENQNSFPVKLLRRHWFIFDSVGVNREVEGAGVVGETP